MDVLISANMPSLEWSAEDDPPLIPRTSYLRGIILRDILTQCSEERLQLSPRLSLILPMQ